MDFSLNREALFLFFLYSISLLYRVGKVIRKHMKLNHNHPHIICSS